LHPVMPFITEELWHEMGYGGDGGYIMNAPWPQPADAGALARLGATDEVLAYVAGKHEVVRAGRALKADFGIAASAEADFVFVAATLGAAGMFASELPQIKSMLKAGGMEVIVAGERDPGPMPGANCGPGTVYLSLDGVDLNAETQRLSKQLDAARNEVKRADAKLANESFVSKAPEQVVARQRELREEAVQKTAKLEGQMETIARALKARAARLSRPG
ncbi:MAG: class I tRNA ligase family protein, partial [Lentisphaerae bacterium]|nr:class I tRNA ligase family protein [Lentisphaerota bacterium]